MSDPKFTPGPWSVDEQEERFDVMYKPEGPKGSPHYHITTLWAKDEHSETDPHFSIERTRADASLIAAAPDLYAACEAALLRDDVADCDLGDMIRAALAKARGEA